jgi:hypothetical protein
MSRMTQPTNRLFLLLLALLVLLPGWVPAPARAGDFTAPQRSGEMHELRSAVLDELRSFRVFLPESYSWDTGQRYPVLYLLDGERHFAHTSSSVEFLAGQGEIPELIVVAVTSNVRVRDFTQTDWPAAWIGGGGAMRFRQFLASELIPHIERTYRTSGLRLLFGHSAGGQFALHVLASQPDLFHAYVALSPSLDWDERLPVRELQAALRHRDRLDAFLYVAEDPALGSALLDQLFLRQVLRSEAPRGLDWRIVSYPDETHTSIPLRAQVDALRAYYHGYRVHADDLQLMASGPGGLAALERRFQMLSMSLRAPIAIPERVLNELGYAQLQAKDLAAATVTFERAVQDYPLSANALDSLAEAYATAGRRDAAAASAQRAAELAAAHGHPQQQYFEAKAAELRNRASNPGSGP